MTTTETRPFDPDALREKYRIERDKRRRPDGTYQYREVPPDLAFISASDGGRFDGSAVLSSVRCGRTTATAKKPIRARPATASNAPRIYSPAFFVLSQRPRRPDAGVDRCRGGEARETKLGFGPLNVVVDVRREDVHRDVAAQHDGVVERP